MTAELPAFSLSEASIAKIHRLYGYAQSDVLFTLDDERVVHQFTMPSATIAVQHQAEVTRRGAVSFSPQMIYGAYNPQWSGVTPFDGERFAIERLDKRAQYQRLDAAPPTPTITRVDARVERSAFVRWLRRMSLGYRLMRAEQWFAVVPLSERRWRGASNTLRGVIDELEVEQTEPRTLPGFSLPLPPMNWFASFAYTDGAPRVEVQIEADRALFRCGDVSVEAARRPPPAREDVERFVAEFREDNESAMLVDPTELREAIQRLTHKTQLELVTFAASKPGFALLSTARKTERIRIGGEAPIAPVSVNRAVLREVLEALEDASELELAFTVDRAPVVFRTPAGCAIRCPSRV